MAIITVVTDVTFVEPGVNVVPEVFAEEDDVKAEVAELVKTPANILFKLMLTLTGVYADKSKGSKNYLKSQNSLANAIVSRIEAKFFSHSDHS